jgi:Zn-dependent M28 family amino/carboxypeptidase
VEVDVKASFTDDEQTAYNTVAEIPGTDKADEVVMVGAHLDSWHGGTGATDNAAGCAVAMEAVRILQSLGVKPRRTIRIALWTGEEQGIFGSRAYVSEHFATRPTSTDPEQLKLPEWVRKPGGPLQIKKEHAHLSAYFNLDNGTGKIRGIYAENNAAVVPIFASWLAPFADLGATTVTLRTTGSTDHVSFDRVGLPGFQFIQDEVEYSDFDAKGLTHHSNMDVYDHAVREDLVQASVVMAAFLYDAAMRTDMLPRKPMPKDDK